MKPSLKTGIVLLAVAFLEVSGCKQDVLRFPDRWFYFASRLNTDQDVQKIAQIASMAAHYGLNGMALSAGLDYLDRQPPEYFRRLHAVKAICDSLGIEIIPMIFSVGYGSAVLAHNPQLAAGLPVKKQPFVAKGDRLVLVKDPQLRFPGGDLEEYQGAKARGVTAHDLPGKVSVPDRRLYKSGRSSLRFEKFKSAPHGNARFIQRLTVKPYRPYRIRFSLRSERLEPEGAFMVQILGEHDEVLRLVHPPLKERKWQEVTVGFNSLGNETVRLYVGVWNGREGRFWLDAFQIEEVALVNLLQRQGTPITVENPENSESFLEGKDFTVVPDTQLNYRFDHPGAVLHTPPTSSIREGDTVWVSYYHALANRDQQVSVCMSEPEVYRIWESNARLIQKHLNPGKYFLSMDEIRSGGTCAACQSRGLSMAQILGDCITRQYNILKKVTPGAEIYIWSDMLDPNHNAHDHVYQVEGDFSGSWDYVPKDLTIVCWNFAIREQSIRHFDRNGFAVMAAAYYDVDDLKNFSGWFQTLSKARKPKGVMYTTWQNRYRFLHAFGKAIEAELNKAQKK